MWVKTERLTLGPVWQPTESDICDVFSYASRLDVAEHVKWKRHQSERDTVTYLGLLAKQWNADTLFIRRGDGEGTIIGSLNFSPIDEESGRWRIGYVMHPGFSGHGYMTEAVNTIVTRGFQYMDVHRIEATPRITNGKSRRLLERSGFACEGILKEALLMHGNYHDVALYAKVNEKMGRLGFDRY